MERAGSGTGRTGQRVAAIWKPRRIKVKLAYEIFINPVKELLQGFAKARDRLGILDAQSLLETVEQLAELHIKNVEPAKRQTQPV